MYPSNDVKKYKTKSFHYILHNCCVIVATRNWCLYKASAGIY